MSIAPAWFATFSRAAEPAAMRRFVCVANPFGRIQDAFFPTEVGLAAALPTNLAPFAPLRGKFTVFSNNDHGNDGGHGFAIEPPTTTTVLSRSKFEAAEKSPFTLIGWFPRSSILLPTTQAVRYWTQRVEYRRHGNP